MPATIDHPTASPFDLASQPWRRAALWRRLILTLLVILQTLTGVYYMITILPYHGGNVVEVLLLVLFALLFLWISVGFWVGVYGFVLRRLGGDAQALARRYPDAMLNGVPLARTAIIMPIYHEPVTRSFGGLKAIYRSLEKTGLIRHFDFFVISDSRDPDIWLAEQEAWYELVRDLKAEGRLFYRRRNLNMNYKSGNVADFLRRWGRHYEYVVVLDADSLMGGEALVKMVRLMQSDARIGILQTNPRIINGQSLFARAQQFANQVYGPLFSTGLAALQLGEAAYWGHNAIIRVQPFMRHCGLPHLTGPGLFNGPISSHDFVEAAFMARAGYEVWLEPELTQSYEESPPTLIDELSRDRRWAKGNLQHLWLLLFEPKLRFAHRMAFLNGVMSYLGSPLWFAFLALTTVEATYLVISPPDYFPEAYSPFPLWPEWHPEWAIGLALGTLFLLFLPKLLACVDVLLGGRARQYGGAMALAMSTLLEIFVSTLLAAVRMLSHTRFVLEAVFNLRLRWAGQNRTEETRWHEALSVHAWGTLIGISWAIFAWQLKPMFFYWSLPVALPLILAVPTSVLLSRTALGARLRTRHYLLVPEERQRPELLDDLESHLQQHPANLDDEPPVIRALVDPLLNQLHLHFAGSHRGGVKHAHLQTLVARCLEQGPAALSRTELNTLLRDRDSLRAMHAAIWQAGADSLWGRHLEQRERKPVKLLSLDHA